MPLLLAILISIFAILGIAPLRRIVLTGPLFQFIKKTAPKISPIEKQAIEAGSAGFDAELFAGKPDWDLFRSKYKLKLTEEEQAFLDGPTQEFCSIIDDWHVRGEARIITDEIWDFAKKHGFLGLRVSKEAGGHGFSAQAQSIILGTVASRSLDASVTVEVPNSLGPDELLEEYGTQEQKEKYLKALVSGEEIACFAITSPTAGSDAASMRDVGYLGYKTVDGKKTLGITVTWSKRYITLAPKATVMALAFHLFDPENILGKGYDRGITLALIPTSHKGVEIGRRHLPGGSVFPNGPTWGNEVFIPLDWVVGGETGVGEGWKMVMQCLAAGRGISLPSMSASATKLLLRTSSAYARIRRQFNKPIGRIEGIQEPLARLAEAAYITESARATTASMVTRETRPLVIASIMKYQTTEYARKAINDAMDIHGGRGIIDGPSNYLQTAYQIAPVAITVEGANIITRSLIVIGQAVLRSHPFFKKELDAFEESDERTAIQMFDRAISAHVLFFIGNGISALLHNITAGAFAHGGSAPSPINKWYKQLSYTSKRFAFLADLTVILYQNKLKKKQKIGGRITDALSELYLMSCVLKRYEEDGLPKEDYPIVELCLTNGLFRFEQSMSEAVDNMHVGPFRPILRLFTSPWFVKRRRAPDTLGEKVAMLMLEPNATRDRLTRFMYIPKDTDEVVGLLEAALEKSVQAEPIMQKVERAIRAGTIERYHTKNWILEAKDAGILTEEEASLLEEVETLVERATAVDHFDPKDIHGVRAE